MSSISEMSAARSAGVTFISTQRAPRVSVVAQKSECTWGFGVHPGLAG